MADPGLRGDNGLLGVPLLSTSPSRLHQSVSRLEVTGLAGAPSNNGNDDDPIINSQLLQPTSLQRQLFSEPEQSRSRKEKLLLKNLITGQDLPFVEKATRALIAALGSTDISLNATNLGIFNQLPKNQQLRFGRGAGAFFSDEIDRRCFFYHDYVQMARPKQWNLEKKIDFLNNNPMQNDKSSQDIQLLKNTLVQLKALAQNVISSHREQADRRDMTKKRWLDVIPWLRFIMCFTDDRVKEKFLQRHAPLHREELDARGTGSAPRDYRHYVAEIFNDSNKVFNVPAMPHVHQDFAEAIECPLTVSVIDVEEVGKRLQNMKMLLTTMKLQWERSGSGSYMMLSKDDTHYRSEEEVYQFVDGDDRQSFLSHVHNKTHILVWWDIAYGHQLLSSVMEQLVAEVGGDGASIPSARSARKQSTRRGETAGFQEKHFRCIDQMSEKMDAMVELKLLESLSNQIKTKLDRIRTLTPEIWDWKMKLYQDFQVEEDSFCTICSDDGFAVKMYKTKLREAKQEKAALENDIIDLEEKIRKRDESKKRPANNVVPTSVRKQRRGEGGTSATSAVTNMSYDDDFSDDGSNEEENFDDGSNEEEN